MNDNYLKGFAEAIVPYLMPYVENKVKDELSNLPNSTKGEPELLTKGQVMTKYQISAMTLWRMEQKGELIPVRLSNRVFYRQTDIDNLFK
jgi:hypothetical protein